MSRLNRFLYCLAMVALGMVTSFQVCHAGEPTAEILVATTNWEVTPMEARAFLGASYGIGTLLIPVGNIPDDLPIRLNVFEKEDRILYPSIAIEPIPGGRLEGLRGDRRIGRGALMEKLRNAIQSGRDALQPPQAIRVAFLFRGKSPLEIQLKGDLDYELSLVPEPISPGSQDAMLRVWWQNYTKQTKKRLAKSDYPPLVETYLTSMLSGRLGLPEVELRDESRTEKLEEPLSTLALLAGTEAIRRECLIEAMRPPSAASRDRTSLPSAPMTEYPVPPATSPDLPIEPLASMVPPECFYLRFGKFSNYLWFDQLSSQRSGDLAQLAMLRGYNYETDARMERILNAKMTTLTKLFGDSVISDVAIIGRDLYMQEGPTLGVLMEAKNMAILRTALQQDRVAASQQHKGMGAVLETVRIKNRDVSFLHTPDHRIRSFLVEHDRFVFLTTSMKLAERFLEVADGSPSLASTPHFRYSRFLLPLQNDFTIFAYLSPEFFHGLISPQYQIELRRRLTALAHLEMAEMALFAAKGEKVAASTIDELIQTGFLPKWFHDRADGSRTLRKGEDWIDSLRGRRGSFLPIADVEIGDVSVEEVQQYSEQSRFYEKDWRQTDPLVFGLRRFTNPDQPELERVTLEAYVAPFGKEKYGWITSFLAPPVETQIQLPEEDVANIQVHMAGSGMGRRLVPDHVLFVGVKDMIPPPATETKGLVQTLRTLKQTPAYLGAWPLPGYLDRLPLGLGGGLPDALGFSRMALGLWRWQGDGFSVISFDRAILDDCRRQLGRAPAKDPAQARIRVGDLGGSQLAKWVNGVWYARGTATTKGNVLLLDAMQQQLHIPPKESLQIAQRLLDCRIQCPLGGEYVYDGENGTWNSTRLPQENWKERLQPPDEYQAPWLEWFRGGQAHFTQLDDRLVLIGQFDMKPLPPHPQAPDADSSPLPKLNFDLFGLPFQFLKESKKEP